MRKYTALLPVAAAYAASALTYSRLPINATLDVSPLLPVDVVSGETIPSIVAALAIPTIALLVYLLLNRLATVSGPARNAPEWWLNETTGSAAVKRFEPTYHTVVFGVTSLLALIHLVILGSILQWPGWFFQGFTAVIGIGYIAIGNVMPRVRPNWIVGIRTKRIMSDPRLWAKAHRTLGMLLMSAGVLTIIASFAMPRWALLVAVLSLLVSLSVPGLSKAESAASHA